MWSKNTPDKWVVVEVHTKDGEILYKVLASWYGGYAGSDEWRFSSGITKVVHHDKHYDIHNHSGSVYTCYKNSRGMSSFTADVFHNLKKQLEEKDMGTMKISVSALLEDQFKPGEINE